MTKEQFEQQLRQAVLRPESKMTEAWYAYGLDMCGEFSHSFLEEMVTVFGFLANNFSPEAVQAVYDTISCATLLPSEMVAAAVHMQNGATAEQIATLADQGSWVCCAPIRCPPSCCRPFRKSGLFQPRTVSAKDNPHEGRNCR